MKSEKERFKAQYTEKQWAKLCGKSEFMEPWDSGNLVKAGEVADKIIEGEATNIKDARIQKQIYNLLGDLME